MVAHPGGRAPRQGSDAAEWFAQRTETYKVADFRVRRTSKDIAAAFKDCIVVEATGVAIRLPIITVASIGSSVLMANTAGGAGTIECRSGTLVEGSQSTTLSAGERVRAIATDLHTWLLWT